MVAVFALTQAPLSNDTIGIATTVLAITFWGVGSLLNSFTDEVFKNSQLLAQFSYAIFYPLLLAAIPRLINRGRALNPIEILDAAIFGLGVSSMATALVFSKVFPQSVAASTEQFFALLFPICDLLLLVSGAITLITHRAQMRAITLFTGIAIFASSDLLYLSLVINDSYAFGQLTDDGWLLGICLVALSFWQPQIRSTRENSIHPIFIAISIFMSPTLLALIALRPETFPIYIIAPTIATLLLAFIRMTIVIRQAKNLGEEKVLARTDDMTGLPNRRRFLAEIDAFSREKGALLLLDLNNFKPVNDQYGHEVGNLVLQQAAQRFTRALPTGAILARLGGDEFGVLIAGSYEETLEVAYAIRATLTYPMNINGATIEVGVSVGHVFNDGEGNLLERADAAMYRAKKSGEGVVQASRL